MQFRSCLMVALMTLALGTLGGCGDDENPSERSAAKERKSLDRELRDLIHADKVKPSWVVSHHFPLEQAPDAYKHFDARDDGWTEVVLHPNGQSYSPTIRPEEY